MKVGYNTFFFSFYFSTKFFSGIETVGDDKVCDWNVKFGEWRNIFRLGYFDTCLNSFSRRINKKRKNYKVERCNGFFKAFQWFYFVFQIFVEKVLIWLWFNWSKSEGWELSGVNLAIFIKTSTRKSQKFTIS